MSSSTPAPASTSDSESSLTSVPDSVLSSDPNSTSGTPFASVSASGSDAPVSQIVSPENAPRETSEDSMSISPEQSPEARRRDSPSVSQEPAQSSPRQMTSGIDPDMLPVSGPQSPQHQRTRPGWNFEIYSDPEEFTFPAGWPSSEQMNSEYRSVEDNKENRPFLAAATEARQPRRPPRQIDQSAVALGPRDAFGSPFMTRHTDYDDEAGN